ncbi:hypothetical protein FB446DRAFT_709906 [Lentinula raphanica]|nr:hypothetical protein FB446DRAFT_709906 [Lentinula raphanica]
MRTGETIIRKGKQPLGKGKNTIGKRDTKWKTGTRNGGMQRENSTGINTMRKHNGETQWVERNGEDATGKLNGYRHNGETQRVECNRENAMGKRNEENATGKRNGATGKMQRGNATGKRNEDTRDAMGNKETGNEGKQSHPTQRATFDSKAGDVGKSFCSTNVLMAGKDSPEESLDQFLQINAFQGFPGPWIDSATIKSETTKSSILVRV